MNLPTPPEPTLEKENEYAFSRPHPRLTVARLTKANIKQGTWIVSYLWTQCGWKDTLKRLAFPGKNL